MDRASVLFDSFSEHFPGTPTPDQESMFRAVADFAVCDDADILVINGYAGTGKTSAVSAVIAAFSEFKTPSILLAPTGRAAKVLSSMSGRQAYTIHKHIYRQKNVGEDGYGQFNLSPNKSKGALFVVDEVSLIGIDSGNGHGTTSFGSGNLLADLVDYVRSGIDCKLILIGDSAQLPPVGLEESPALSEDFMMLFGGVRFARLSTVVRQDGNSSILRNATHLRDLISSASGNAVFNNLKLDLTAGKDVERVSGSELVECLNEAYSRFGEDETIVLCRSNRRANKYNNDIRTQVQFKEERLVSSDRLMIVKNCYQFLEGVDEMDYIANGDMAKLGKISGYEERYGLHFADAWLSFPDYEDCEIKVKVCLDTLESESAALTYEQQNALYLGVNADYDYIVGKKKRYEMVREDKYFNALQLKYAEAITCHKSQGGQWKCVFIDNPFWHDEQTVDDLKWLYTALTRAVEKVYLVNFKDRFFK